MFSYLKPDMQRYSYKRRVLISKMCHFNKTLKQGRKEKKLSSHVTVHVKRQVGPNITLNISYHCLFQKVRFKFFNFYVDSVLGVSRLLPERPLDYKVITLCFIQHF